MEAASFEIGHLILALNTADSSPSQASQATAQGADEPVSDSFLKEAAPHENTTASITEQTTSDLDLPAPPHRIGSPFSRSIAESELLL